MEALELDEANELCEVVKYVQGLAAPADNVEDKRREVARMRRQAGDWAINGWSCFCPRSGSMHPLHRHTGSNVGCAAAKAYEVTGRFLRLLEPRPQRE